MQGLGSEGMWKHRQLRKRRRALEAQGNWTKTFTIHCLHASLCLPALLYHYDHYHRRAVAFIASVSSELHVVALLTWSWPALTAAEPLLPGSPGTQTAAGNSATEPGYANRLPKLLPKTLDVLDYLAENMNPHREVKPELYPVPDQGKPLSGRQKFLCLPPKAELCTSPGDLTGHPSPPSIHHPLFNCF